MAYFCLTFLEWRSGGREPAASKFRIAKTVLDRLGNLTSTRGDAETGRKYSAVASGQPLSNPERTWIEAAVATVIRRLGELHNIDSLEVITLADLPKLP